MKTPAQLWEMIRGFVDSDYELVFAYNRIDQCCEVVRGKQNGSLNDVPKPITTASGDYIYFKTNNEGILPFYRAKQQGGQFELFELTYEAYCKYGF